jgi:hypothetical protein
MSAENGLSRIDATQAELAELGDGVESGDPEALAWLAAIWAELAELAIAEGKPNRFGPKLLDTLAQAAGTERRRLPCVYRLDRSFY